MFTHSWLQRIRSTDFINQQIYPYMVKWIYERNQPYITEDERKLDERDLDICRKYLADLQVSYFNLALNRLVPDRFQSIAKADRWTLRAAGVRGVYLGGRAILSGQIEK